jgi:hypothetical protein
LKKLFLILFLSFVCFCAFAQADTGFKTKAPDTAVGKVPHAVVKKVRKAVIADTLKKSVITDTLKKPDSLAKTDSVFAASSDTHKPIAADTAKHSARAATIKKPIDSIYLKLLDNPFTKTNVKPIYLVIDERDRPSKDEVFYLICGLLLFLAFIKLVFSRYFKNVFRVFFQPSFRQKQTREQLLQNNLPSLLLNLFFIFSAGAYASFLIQYYRFADIGFWALLLYCTLSLLLLYAGKFIFLSFTGWVFDFKEAANAYIFAVYLINKILGVILIPFILVIAFSQPFIINISITISLLLIFLLYLYRYLISYSPVRKELKVSVLHFFLYLFAFEIIPLLLIYKTLIIYMDKSL